MMYRSAKAGCFLQGNGYDPSPPTITNVATLPPPLTTQKRSKSEDIAINPVASERRRRSEADSMPPSTVKKSHIRDAAGSGSKQIVEDEEIDHTLYCYCLKRSNSEFDVKFCIFVQC